MKKIFNLLTFLMATYPCGIILGIILKVLCFFRVVRISHWERFPHWQGKLILVSNHPSLLEIFLLPALFFREYLFHPLKYAPWNTPDKKNYYDPWYFFWLRPVSVPIDRTDERAQLSSFFRIKELLNSGKIIILFPEGGRTFKGGAFLYSRSGKRIRILKDGIGWLILKTGAMVIPVWVEGSDQVLPNHPDKLFVRPNFKKRMEIRIGEPLKFQGSSASGRERVNQIIVSELLKLADEEE